MSAAAHLARNLRQLRAARGLSQARLAELTGVPRPTLGTLESGSANPTLSVMVKLSTALQVTLEELVAPPKAEVRHYRSDELPVQRARGVEVRQLLPDPVAGVELERMELAAGAVRAGVPHTPGTREYLCCERGQLVLTAGGQQWELGPGEVVVFPGHQRHAYRNPGSSPAVAYSVLLVSR